MAKILRLLQSTSTLRAPRRLRCETGRGLSRRDRSAAWEGRSSCQGDDTWRPFDSRHVRHHPRKSCEISRLNLPQLRQHSDSAVIRHSRSERQLSARLVGVPQQRERPRPAIQLLTSCCNAARQSGHSHIVQHFFRSNDRRTDIANIHVVALNVSSTRWPLQERTQIGPDAWIGGCHRLELLGRQFQFDRQAEKVDQLTIFRSE